MSILFPQYLTIKNKYCFAYFGVFDEFIRQLIYLRPHLEKQYPGLDLYIACKDGLINQHSHVPRMIARSNLYKSEYAYVRDIVYNQINHPIQEIIEENNLEISANTVLSRDSKKCLITSEGMRPFPSLDATAIAKLKMRAMRLGYYCEVGNDLNDVEWVIGVENDTLYNAATQGIKTTLVAEDKASAKVFTKLFPSNDLLLVDRI